MYPDSGKDENEDTVMHEYIHDTFKETFRDSNYETVWYVLCKFMIFIVPTLISFNLTFL